MADNNINIKVLIDAADAAKTVGETRQALRDLRGAAMSVEEGSQAFQDITKAAGQLQDKIGDLQATTKYFANDMRKLEGLSSIGEGIAGGFALAQGAVSLLGGENKKLEESLLKVQSAMAVLQGLQAVGNVLQKESAASLFIQNGLRSVAVTLTSEQAVAEAAEAVAAGTATIAQRALNSAMSANPIGILITLIVAGVAALTLWSDKTKEVTEAQKALNAETLKTRTNGEIELKTFNSQIEALKQLKTGSEERAIAIKKINDTYGLTLKNLSDEDKFLKQVNLAQKDYIEGSKNRITIKINEAKVESLLTESQIAREKSLWAAKKASDILDNDISLKNAIRGKSRLELMNTIFGSEEGREYQRMITLENNSKIESDALNKRADNILSINGRLLSQETDQQKTAREKEEKDEADALAKKQAEDTKANTKVITDKKALDQKLLDEQLKYAQLVKDINNDIYNMNVQYNGLLLKDYEDTLQGQLDAQKAQETASLKEQQDAFDKRVEEVKQTAIKISKLQGTDLSKLFSISSTGIISGSMTAELINAQQLLDRNKTLIVKQGVEERDKIESGELERRLERARESASIILGEQDYNDFIQFEKRFQQHVTIIRRIGDELKTEYLTFDELTGIKLTDDIESIMSSATPTLVQQYLQDFTNDIDENAKKVKPVITDSLRSVLSFDEVLKSSLGESEKANELLRLIYSDKFNIIQSNEEKINAKRRELNKSEFAVKPKEGQVGLEGLEEGELKSLSDELAKRYKTISTTRKKIFDDELKAAYEKYISDIGKIDAGGGSEKDKTKDKKKATEQLFKDEETAKEKHNDVMLVIDRAYGKADEEQLNAYHKKKFDKQDTEDKKLLDKKKRLNSEIIALEQQLQAAVMSIFNNNVDIAIKSNNKRYNASIKQIETEEAKYKASVENRTIAQQQALDIEAGFAEQKANAERKRQIQEDNIKRKQFNAQKANDALTVGISTAIAIMRTVADFPETGGLPFSAIVAAMGAIQEGAILSKKYVPTYSKGGLVTGPGSGTSDSIDAKLSNGEVVINANSSRRFGPLLNAINTAGGGRAIPNTGSNTISTPESSSSIDTQSIVDAIERLNDRPVETYVNESRITDAQRKASQLKRRTSF